MNGWLLYLFLKLDGLQTLLACLLLGCVCSAVLTLIYMFNGAEHEDLKATWQQVKGVFMWFVWGSVLSGALLLVLPSSRQMAVVYVVPKLLDSPVIQRDIPRLYDLAMTEIAERVTDKRQERTLAREERATVSREQIKRRRNDNVLTEKDKEVLRERAIVEARELYQRQIRQGVSGKDYAGVLRDVLEDLIERNGEVYTEDTHDLIRRF